MQSRNNIFIPNSGVSCNSGVTGGRLSLSFFPQIKKFRADLRPKQCKYWFMITRYLILLFDIDVCLLNLNQLRGRGFYQQELVCHVDANFLNGRLLIFLTRWPCRL